MDTESFEKYMIDEADAKKTTPLYESVIKGDVSEVKRLLFSGVDINEKAGKFISTPLYMAVRDDNIEIVKTLLDAGADFNIRSRYGDTPLNCAVVNGGNDIIMLLVKFGADLEDNFINLLIWTDINSKSEQTVKFLLQLGVDPNKPNRDGVTPLFCAASCGNLQNISSLLRAGADINKLNQRLAGNQCSYWEEYAPIHGAYISGKVDALRLLISAGAMGLEKPGVAYSTNGYCKKTVEILSRVIDPNEMLETETIFIS